MANSDELLSFKEYIPSNNSESAQININSPKHNTNYNFSNEPDFLIAGDLSDGPPKINTMEDEGLENKNENKSYSFFSIEYYQQFFNIDTQMVVDRILLSMIPKKAPPNYLKNQIVTNPDLYGPFWIIITLIFSIAISGNISNYFQHSETDYHWKYNFHLVSYAATAIIFYASFIPLSLWGAFKWTIKPVDPDLETDLSSFTPSLLGLICIYGYSLSIYIPVSILWVIQINFMQWLFLITAAFLSGSVLIFILMPALRNSKFSLFIMIGIVTAHFLLAAGFMLYFFHVPDVVTKIIHTSSTRHH